MEYCNIVDAVFLQRPNRFIAHCRLKSGEEVVAHVKNTGRCRELLIPGTKVYLQDHREEQKARKTAFSLIAVEKQTERGPLLINMDSQAPNQIAADGIWEGHIALPLEAGEELLSLRREVKYGDSRFDVQLASSKKLWYVEVKGVTLEEKQIARFPDAPTERGVKHIHELIKAKEAGHRAAVLFIVQMPGVEQFTPNWRTHPDFGFALEEAAAAGVEVLAYGCHTAHEEGSLSITAAAPIPVELSHRRLCTHFAGEGEEALLSLLTDQDKELLSTFHNGKAMPESWLCQALMRKAAMELGFRDVIITRNEKGAPITNSKGLSVSASHTEGCCVGAASLRPMGVDAEALTPPHEKAAKRVFSAAEQSWLESQPDQAAAFTKLWTLKEAYGKMRGMGLAAAKEADFSTAPTDLCIHSEKVGEHIISLVEK